MGLPLLFSELINEEVAPGLRRGKRPRKMKSRVHSRRSQIERHAGLSFCLLVAVLAGTIAVANAAQILAGAQMSGVSLGGGNYKYTLTLENTAASTSEIGMFWFAWEAGQADFLASEPTSIQTPTGWVAVVEGGDVGDGYSIQFVTFTNALKPGSSVTFTFNSGDSPSIMAGPASLYPQYPTLTSQVYSHHAASGLQQVFVAKLVSANLGKLGAQPVGSDLVLTWQAGTNVVLQQASTMNPGSWNSIPGTLGMGTYTVTNAVGSSCAFYRLAAR